MIIKDKVVRIVYKGIDEFNEVAPRENRIRKSLGTVLFGRDGVLDSLGLATFIAAVERHIEDGLDVILTLADEKAISQKNSPFKTIERLVDYILLLLENSPKDKR